MSTKGFRVSVDIQLRTENVTAPMLPIPRESHPIWDMGHDHVTVAHSLCNLVYRACRAMGVK